MIVGADDYRPFGGSLTVYGSIDIDTDFDFDLDTDTDTHTHTE